MWTSLLAIMGIGCLLPYSVRDLLLGWNRTFLEKVAERYGWATPVCLFFFVCVNFGRREIEQSLKLKSSASTGWLTHLFIPLVLASLLLTSDLCF